MNESNDSTTKPGRLVSDHDTRTILPVFLKKYRVNELNGIPSNLPTACTLKGIEGEKVLKSGYFFRKSELYVLFENPQILYLASGQSILKFLESRQPWEDYDICIFDSSLLWCIGITHNDKVVLVDNTNVFDQAKDVRS